MGKAKDRELIWDAADSWLNEMEEYIVPGVLTKEERKSYRKQADQLRNAMAREAERERRKALRDKLTRDERDERHIMTGGWEGRGNDVDR